jgi:hypothetical protein
MLEILQPDPWQVIAVLLGYILGKKLNFRAGVIHAISQLMFLLEQWRDLRRWLRLYRQAFWDFDDRRTSEAPNDLTVNRAADGLKK